MDRDPKTQRFLPGNKASVGHKSRASDLAYHDAIREIATPEHVGNVIKRLYVDAMRGKHAAAQLYLAYAVGQPKQILELRPPQTLKLAQIIAIFDERGMDVDPFLDSLLNQIMGIEGGDGDTDSDA